MPSPSLAGDDSNYGEKKMKSQTHKISATVVRRRWRLSWESEEASSGVATESSQCKSTSRVPKHQTQTLTPLPAEHPSPPPTS